MKFSSVVLSYALLVCRGEDEQKLPMTDGLPTAIIVHDRRSKKSKSPTNSEGGKSKRGESKKKSKKKKCKKLKKDGKEKKKGKGKTKSPTVSTSTPWCPETDPVLPISLGEQHSCVGGYDQGLQCWGFNDKGQVGDGTDIQKRSYPKTILLGNGSYPLHQIVLGYSHTCTIDNEDYLLCWGSNEYGQLGDTTTTDKNIPTIISLGSGSGSPTKIALGYEHTCSIDSLNNLKCWGRNNKGQLGDGTTVQQRSAPTVISFGTGPEYATEIALGYEHSCAIDSLKQVRCWGHNELAQLGDGTNDNRSTPTLISLGTDTDFATKIAAGDYHTCAIDDKENLKCWGRNHKGQLGDNTLTQRKTPLVISLGQGNPAPREIALGGAHTCAIDDLDRLKCWGWNEYGQVGNGGQLAEYKTPNLISLGANTFATGIALGRYHTCAMDNMGNLKCWGNGSRGQLGDGTTDDSLVPKVILGPDLDSTKSPSKKIPSKPTTTKAPSPNPLSQKSIAPLTLGEYHTCHRDDKKKLRCWGSNDKGQVGDGTSKKMFSYPAKISLGKDSTRAIQIVLGYSHTCIIDNEDYLLCWGSNEYGQLGDTTTTDKNIPTIISLGSGSGSPTKIALGYEHTCSIDSLNNLKCWGRNNKGQLGDGTTVQQRSAPTVISFGTGPEYATEIALGYEHSCAIDSLKQVRCWGGNEFAQLGDGTNDNRSTPTLISLGTDTDFATKIAAGDYHTCAIDDKENLKCWGRNHKGQLGDNTLTQRKTPLVISLGQGNPAPREIALGGAHTCAIDDSDRLKCWGWNEYGQVGNGGQLAEYKTQNLISLGANTFATGIALGRYHTCAMDNMENLKCWGHGSRGQLGDGTTDDSLVPKVILGPDLVPSVAQVCSVEKFNGKTLVASMSVPGRGTHCYRVELVEGGIFEYDRNFDGTKNCSNATFDSTKKISAVKSFSGRTVSLGEAPGVLYTSVEGAGNGKILLKEGVPGVMELISSSARNNYEIDLLVSSC